MESNEKKLMEMFGKAMNMTATQFREFTRAMQTIGLSENAKNRFRVLSIARKKP